MSILPIYVGQVLRFSYPRDNRIGAKTSLEKRLFVVERVRNIIDEPIEPWAIEDNPDVRRCEWLLWGRDLACNDVRQFYYDSMTSQVVLDTPVRQLAIYDNELCEPVSFFGPLWVASQADDFQIRRTVQRLQPFLTKRDPQLSIRVLPFRGVDRHEHSRQSA